MSLSRDRKKLCSFSLDKAYYLVSYGSKFPKSTYMERSDRVIDRNMAGDGVEMRGGEQMRTPGLALLDPVAQGGRQQRETHFLNHFLANIKKYKTLLL